MSNLSRMPRDERKNALCPRRYLFLQCQNAQNRLLTMSAFWERLPDVASFETRQTGLLLLAQSCRSNGNTSVRASMLSRKCAVLVLQLARLNCHRDRLIRNYFALLSKDKDQYTKHYTALNALASTAHKLHQQGCNYHELNDRLRCVVITFHCNRAQDHQVCKYHNIILKHTLHDTANLKLNDQK